MHTGSIYTLDLDRDGKTLSRIGMPFSVDRSPYFQVTISICVARNGAGPAVLLMAGNHGDEYEGELSLARLVRKLDPGAHARPRHHSADGECARCNGGAAQFAPRRRQSQSRFPRRSERTADFWLAHFLEKDLFPRHDVVFDIHSGGTAMAHLVCALIERNAEPARHERAATLMRQLGTPYGFVADNGQDAPTSMGAARRAGAIGVSGEFGGGGTTTTVSMAAASSARSTIFFWLLASSMLRFLSRRSYA